MTPFSPDEQFRFLEVLAHEESAWISREVVPLTDTLWGLHGFIPYDGEVLMAEFASYEDAKNALDRLP